MAAVCPRYLRGRRMRGTRLDACGRPVGGAAATVVTSGFIRVQMSPEIEEGEEITQRNAAGELCISEPGEAEVKWLNTTIDFCQVDTDLVLMMNPTWRKVVDSAGNTVGFAEKGKLSSKTGIALELWMDTVGSDICDDPDAEGAWGYLLLPRVTGGVPGDLTVENGAVTFTLVGKAVANNRWLTGPYNVTLVDGDPSPLLDPMATDEYRLIMQTGVAPPAAVCGAQALTVPAAPTMVNLGKDNSDATGMTATLTGSPGAPGNTMHVDWGDGTAKAVLGLTATTHAYSNPGTYRVVVRDDVTGQVAARVITVPFP